eukprot:TRINITY_DN2310_c1_g1_i1.p1 TRINITY_DN2310_c1_g1~~TRINITY_DN2310_c1_g1_i1.p1  ORF type:complete len:402 (-),score=48.34 TRINITY_DN2310_c1_g1_i1:90-1295(-)
MFKAHRQGRNVLGSVTRARKLPSCATSHDAKSSASMDAPAEPATGAIDPENYVAPSESVDFDLQDGADPSLVAGQFGAVAGATAGVVLRGGSGAAVAGFVAGDEERDDDISTATVAGNLQLSDTGAVSSFPRPEKTLILYEFDPCPFSKKVRELIAWLDLDVLFLPCPKQGPTYRPQAYAKAGKILFPYLIDPNTGKEVVEAEAIVRYLTATYGDGSLPWFLQMGPVTVVTSALAAIVRSGKGGLYRRSKQPEEPLVLWGYEASPFTRIVKEILCELEIPHLHKSVARGSPKRQVMIEKYGKFQAPLLEDPNTGVAIFESADIIQYLNDTYALPEDEIVDQNSIDSIDDEASGGLETANTSANSFQGLQCRQAQRSMQIACDYSMQQQQSVNSSNFRQRQV